ncbi:MAG: GAF domain-containing protein [Janthinobacterium lividum]
MFKRPFFWLGLLCGSLAAFVSQVRRPAKSLTDPFALLSELSPDALIVCDDAGAILHSNAAALALFGPQCSGLAGLRYPNGQAVPPGQLPLNRAVRDGRLVVGTGYQSVGADGLIRILDVRAQPLAAGGAAAVFQDATDLYESRARGTRWQMRQTLIQQLCSHLSKAATAEEISRAIVESVFPALDGASDLHVRLYSYNPTAQTISLIASEPEDQPKRPKTSAQARPPVFPFDATIPALWKLYIDRQPSYANGLMMHGENSPAPEYALPLLVGGAAAGHLSLTSNTHSAFDDPVLLETLSIVASIAASALAIPQAAEQAAALQAQADVLREIVRAISMGKEQDKSADAVTEHIRRIIGAEVCTLSVPLEDKLSIAGEAFRDALLFSKRVKPDDTALHGKVVQKAWRTQKVETQSAVKNPSFEAGPWRAFAGKSGTHSVIAVPLANRQGVLTVYTDGTLPLPENQVKFLETIAALLSMTLRLPSFPVVETSS